ncbi:hypothetical protein RSAG8_11051, partial [Rhizoctonia solani AG-8 WAC10335]
MWGRIEYTTDTRPIRPSLNSIIPHVLRPPFSPKIHYLFSQNTRRYAPMLSPTQLSFAWGNMVEIPMCCNSAGEQSPVSCRLTTDASKQMRVGGWVLVPKGGRSLGAGRSVCEWTGSWMILTSVFPVSVITGRMRTHSPRVDPAIPNPTWDTAMVTARQAGIFIPWHSKTD